MNGAGPRTDLAWGALLLALGACATPGAEPAVDAAGSEAPELEFRSWGTMREVLRLGQSEGRVALTQEPGLAAPGTIAVGALAGLEGEVTVLDGRTLVARGAELAQDPRPSPGVRVASDRDSAALLLAATVDNWESVALGSVASYEELEARIKERRRALGHDLGQPCPVRVQGRASSLALHVIAGSCPIAEPDGEPPWRFEGPAQSVDLVGFHVEGAAGQFTHHDRASHLHAVAAGLMGHLDRVALEDATLLLPADF